MQRLRLVHVAVFAVVGAPFLAGCTTAPPPPSAPSLTLSAAPWVDYNITVAITAVERAAGLSPSNLTYDIRDQHNDTWFYGPAGPDTVSQTSTKLAVYYNDSNGAGEVSAGDSIQVVVVSPYDHLFDGGRLIILREHVSPTGVHQVPDTLGTTTFPNR